MTSLNTMSPCRGHVSANKGWRFITLQIKLYTQHGDGNYRW